MEESVDQSDVNEMTKTRKATQSRQQTQQGSEQRQPTPKEIVEMKRFAKKQAEIENLTFKPHVNRNIKVGKLTLNMHLDSILFT